MGDEHALETSLARLTPQWIMEAGHCRSSGWPCATHRTRYHERGQPTGHRSTGQRSSRRRLPFERNTSDGIRTTRRRALATLAGRHAQFVAARPCMGHRWREPQSHALTRTCGADHLGEQCQTASEDHSKVAVCFSWAANERLKSKLHTLDPKVSLMLTIVESAPTITRQRRQLTSGILRQSRCQCPRRLQRRATAWRFELQNQTTIAEPRRFRHPAAGDQRATPDPGNDVQWHKG